MPAGSEFHTEGTATLKLREAKVVWTRVGMYYENRTRGTQKKSS